MPTIAPNQSSNCTTPVLDLFTSVGGVPTDVSVLEFVIFEKVTVPGVPTQVYPVAGRASVDIVNDCPVGHRIEEGHYVAEWDVDAAEPLGDHEIVWYFKLTPVSSEETYTEEFTVAPTTVSSQPGLYCSLQDIRDEGVSAVIYPDARVLKLIRVASRMIDRYTGRFFSPVKKTLALDGRGTTVLFLNEPIIDITSVQIALVPGTVSPISVDLSDLSIYNRHLTENLLDPDDRNNPKIEFWLSNTSIARVAPSAALAVFPVGRQNVTVAGIFGYTDYDGSTYGQTPDLINQVCQRMVMRLLPKKIKTAISGSGPVWKEVTRDQRVEYANPDRLAIAGAFTGDPEIDTILASYRRPPHIGAA